MRFGNLLRDIKKLINITKPRLAGSVVGLEINSESIKLLKIHRNNESYEVGYFAIIPLPKGTVVKDEIKDFNVLASLLKNTFYQTGANSRNVALAIPRSSAIIKDITIDGRLREEEIESRVWIEANRFFPNLIGEIYLDFVVISENKKDSSQREIILVACRKEQIDPYINVVRMADLSPRIIDIDSYALERALACITGQVPALKTIAFLNINYSLITLIVLHEGSLVYTHELNYDGYNFMRHTQEVATKSNAAPSFGAAQVESREELPNLESLKNSLGLHLRHTMQFFYSSRPNIRIEQLILGGDCVVAVPELQDYIQKETGKETVLADPFVNMKIADNVDTKKLKYYAPALMLCCGLALSKINGI